ncbi:OmpH family outer membrane protein [Aquirufa ecclesiirivi]|uniref:OmpH family outer membrane protein n=1 Tax=Aquirufa ecclesiirivi TaxID=2715124 RepID=A0ABT4JJ05_9BACT|nr:OmpH family outer membrane protein [Aquirufa ecclesiirivi]MCZ2471336.1 OmpH family outer membrane protein [Aquirufa ecclesiirivi]MCZ2475958.1 OmpH family outer membrane protein [Aquirufa ecclesiirivi]MDF0693028.1 OmpH family outer membrane protein [Aquirufa ecclesiirivi]NHC49842.1 OmpH family outer membrane protein [Aquirufa ecclesiirivi]
MKTKFLLAMGLVFGMAVMPLKAQIKIGFINADYILSQMPEAKQVEEDLKNTQKQYETLYQGKVKDFQDKLAVFEKLPASTADIIKQDREKELQNLQTSIQEFQQNSQSSLQKKQAQLLQPLLKKIEENMHAVANENAYTYVFNYDAGMGTAPILLHYPAEASISDLVLKKMGITPKPVTATPAAATTAPATKTATPATKK